MLSPRDLGMILQPPPDKKITFGQAIVLEWDLSVPGGTAIDWRGITLRNVPVVSGIDIFTIKVGDVVGVLGWAPSSGMGSWWIVGQIVGTDKVNDSVELTQGTVTLGDGSDLIIRSDTDNRWIQLTEGAIWFNTVSGLANVSPGFIRIETADENEPYLQMTGPAPRGLARNAWYSVFSSSTANGSGFARMTTGGIDAGEGDPGAQVRLSNSAVIAATELVRITAGTTTAINSGSATTINAGTSATFTATNAMTLNSAGGSIRLQSNGFFIIDSNSVGIPNQNTTTAAANMFITTGGNIGTISRSTSARRYKTDIEPYSVSLKDLSTVKPSTWVDTGEKTHNPATKRRHIGLIADELATTPLRGFVDFNAAGEPESIAYDRLAVAALTALAEVSQRLETLEQLAGVTPAPTTTTRIPDRLDDPTTQPTTEAEEEPNA